MARDVDMEVGTAGVFGRPTLAVDVDDVVIVVGRIAVDTGPRDAQAAGPGFCCPAMVASAAALFFSCMASN